MSTLREQAGPRPLHSPAVGQLPDGNFFGCIKKLLGTMAMTPSLGALTNDLQAAFRPSLPTPSKGCLDCGTCTFRQIYQHPPLLEAFADYSRSDLLFLHYYQWNQFVSPMPKWFCRIAWGHSTRDMSVEAGPLSVLFRISRPPECRLSQNNNQLEIEKGSTQNERADPHLHYPFSCSNWL